MGTQDVISALLRTAKAATPEYCMESHFRDYDIWDKPIIIRDAIHGYDDTWELMASNADMLDVLDTVYPNTPESTAHNWSINVGRYKALGDIHKFLRKEAKKHDVKQ